MELSLDLLNPMTNKVMGFFIALFCIWIKNKSCEKAFVLKTRCRRYIYFRISIQFDNSGQHLQHCYKISIGEAIAKVLQ